MIEENVDCLVLGCTHYPYLIPKIKEIIGENIKIIDSGEAVARQTNNILTQQKLLNSTPNTNKNIFYINKSKEVLENFLTEYSNIIVEQKDF